MEILTIIGELAASHMPNLIVRLAFPDEKIMERVYVSQTGGTVADIYLPPEGLAIVVSLQVRSHLPFPIELDFLQGDAQANGYHLVHNFTIPLHEKLKGHIEKTFSPTLDLSDWKAGIVANHLADTFDFSLNAKLVFNALRRKMAKPIRVHVHAVIHGLHGNKN